MCIAIVERVKTCGPWRLSNKNNILFNWFFKICMYTYCINTHTRAQRERADEFIFNHKSHIYRFTHKKYNNPHTHSFNHAIWSSIWQSNFRFEWLKFKLRGCLYDVRYTKFYVLKQMAWWVLITPMIDDFIPKCMHS